MRFIRAGLCASALAVGCAPEPEVDHGPTIHQSEATQVWPLQPLRIVDVLIVVDDSPSMAEEQTKLAANFPAIVDVLEHPDVRADYRIAVVTTSRGAACEDVAVAPPGASCLDHLEDLQWPGGGEHLDAADHRSLCQESCSISGPLTSDGVPWIAGNRWEGGNAMGSPEEALTCAGLRGISGCRFESPIAAVRETIEASFDTESPWYGFLRPDARLMVAIISDEEDCSFANGGEAILDPAGNRVFWSDPDATEATSAACWNAAARCTGAADDVDCFPHQVDVDGELTEDPHEAVLSSLDAEIAWLAEFEANYYRGPYQRLTVGLVGGVSSDGSVNYNDVLADDEAAWFAEFGIGWGCSSDGGTQRAVPPARLRTFVDAFTENNLHSICDDSYAGVLETVASICCDEHWIRPKCFDHCAATVDAEPVCNFALRRDGDTVPIPRCPHEPVDGAYEVPEGSLACTAIDFAQDCLETERPFNVVVEFAPGEPTDGELIATCLLSDEPELDCPQLDEDP